MLFKILSRTGGVVMFGLLVLLRLYFAGHIFLAHRPAAQAEGAYSPLPAAIDRSATIASAADASGWILFTNTDPQSGQRMRHARLNSASDVLIDGHPGPPNVLEVVEQGPDAHHIRLTLRAPSTCPGITSIHAVFGNRPVALAVKPVEHEAGCTVDVLDYGAVLDSLRNNDVLRVSAAGGPEIRFDVAGLSWD